MMLREQLLAGVSNAVSETLSRQYTGCEPLYWRLNGRVGAEVSLSGHPGAGYTDREGVEVATEWAAALGLREGNAVCEGTREWNGTVDGCVITVWCITDRERFYDA